MDESKIHDRKRMRLRDYDYSQGAGYFLTIDVLDRRPILGSVINGEMCLNDLGDVIVQTWSSIEARYPGVLVDEWMVMPDHMHGILLFSSTDPTVKLPNLVDVVRDFKSRTTRHYWDYVNKHHLTNWLTKLWQRSYYERVIRGESDLHEKRNYIRTNPERWKLIRSVSMQPPRPAQGRPLPEECS